MIEKYVNYRAVFIAGAVWMLIISMIAVLNTIMDSASKTKMNLLALTQKRSYDSPPFDSGRLTKAAILNNSNTIVGYVKMV